MNMRNQDALFDGGVPALKGVRSAEDLLQRTGGDSIISFLRSLGFWIDERRSGPAANPPTTYTTPSDATGRELSDMLAYWSSEFARASEILGVLQGERMRLKLALDRVAAEVALEIISQKKKAGEKLPTKAVLDLEVSIAPSYKEAEDRLALLDQAIKAMAGVKEGVQAIRDGISREITRRGDAIRGRIE